MHLKPDSPQRTNEQRRYFPDWTHRSLKDGEELEADHNSYLAGGYAEEFGYRADAVASRGVPLLDGEPPEESEERLVQAVTMHPGYPIRAYPVAPARVRHDGAFMTTPQLHVEAHEVTDHGAFVRVVDRPYERDHHRPGRRVAAMLTRLLAALVAWRWESSHRRRAP